MAGKNLSVLDEYKQLVARGIEAEEMLQAFDRVEDKRKKALDRVSFEAQEWLKFVQKEINKYHSKNN